jgi:hypothetical protein
MQPRSLFRTFAIVGAIAVGLLVALGAGLAAVDDDSDTAAEVQDHPSGDRTPGHHHGDADGQGGRGHGGPGHGGDGAHGGPGHGPDHGGPGSHHGPGGD